MNDQLTDLAQVQSQALHLLIDLISNYTPTWHYSMEKTATSVTSAYASPPAALTSTKPISTSTTARTSPPSPGDANKTNHQLSGKDSLALNTSWKEG